MVTSQKVDLSDKSHTQFDIAVMDEHYYCLQPNSNVFSLLNIYINVERIKTKLKGIYFEQYIVQFDLVCLGETKLDGFNDNCNFWL